MSSPDKLLQINVKFPVKVSALASLILILLTLLFYSEAQSVKETIVFFAVGAAAVGQITTSFFTARLLGSAMQSAEQDLEREKLALAREERTAQREAAHDAYILRREALRFGERWNDPAMSSARDILREIASRKEDPESELLLFIEKNETAVNHILNFLEEIGTCCRYELVDSVIMKEQFDFVVVNTWDSLYPWIRKQQKKYNDNIWEDSERLYRDWKKGLKAMKD